MNLLRKTCIVIAWLWIAFVVLGAILGLKNQLAIDAELNVKFDIAYTIGRLIGYALFFIPSFILFFVAGRIKRKLDKAKRDRLINSFDSI